MNFITINKYDLHYVWTYYIDSFNVSAKYKLENNQMSKSRHNTTFVLKNDISQLTVNTNARYNCNAIKHKTKCLEYIQQMIT